MMRMRKIRLVVVTLVVAALFSLTPPYSRPLQAQSGCCKTRSAAAAPWAKHPELNFAACRAQNQQLDNDDNIFEAAGLVWWDEGCN
jgi:hypothetical protein